ncbi:MAG TPA: ATP-binding protein [Crocinitomicaceae bacterium]|nr:ATP-binding protein [Crocinitomicaceae bacterium]
MGKDRIQYDGLINFGDFSQIVHRGEIDRQIEIRITISISEDLKKEIIYLSESLEKLLGITVSFNDLQRYGISYHLSFMEDKIDQILEIGGSPILHISASEIIRPFKIKEELESVIDSIKILHISWKEDVKDSTLNDLIKILKITMNEVLKSVFSIYYISAIRGLYDFVNEPRRLQIYCPEEFKDFEKLYVGPHGENTLYVLYYLWKYRRSEEQEKISEKLKKFDLGNLISGPDIERGGFTSDYIDNYTGSIVNLRFAGTGSKQILPIIVQLFCVKNSLIMIEEPEISFHAKFQRDFIKDVVKDAVLNNNNKVVFTTHSNIPILSIPLAIDDKFTINSIKVYHFERDSQTFETICEELTLNKFGYLEKPIPSYVRVEKELFSKWLEVQEKEGKEFEDGGDISDRY